jgi:hypothetical protein
MSTDEVLRKHKTNKLSRFKGMSFQLADYSAPSMEWDHDHCESCTAKFAEFDEPEILHRGYFTIYKNGAENSEIPDFIKQMQAQGRKVMAKPDATMWICKECFEDFRSILDWKLESSM